MEQPPHLVLRRHPLLLLFIAAFALTWGGSLLTHLASAQGGTVLPSGFSVPGVLLTLLGPSVSAMIAARVVGGRAGLWVLLGRLRVWRIGWAWHAFIFLYPVALHLLVAGIHRLWGGPAPSFFLAPGVPSGNGLLVLVGLILFNLVRGFGEETGWRGYAPH